jgi:hypothetical protein
MVIPPRIEFEAADPEMNKEIPATGLPLLFVTVSVFMT